MPDSPLLTRLSARVAGRRAVLAAAVAVVPLLSRSTPGASSTTTVGSVTASTLTSTTVTSTNLTSATVTAPTPLTVDGVLTPAAPTSAPGAAQAPPASPATTGQSVTSPVAPSVPSGPAPAWTPTGPAPDGAVEQQPDHTEPDQQPDHTEPDQQPDEQPVVQGQQGLSMLPEPAILHLLRRATFGPTPVSVMEAILLGPDAWLERQLAPASIPDAASDDVLSRFPELRYTIRQTHDNATSVGSWYSMYALGRAALARAVWSERQLYEVMVDFWSNHLNVTCPSSEVWDSRAHYDAAAIRPNALGKFTDLLVAASTHPAMLRYLGNRDSRKTAPNENQARELLELHTVGVDGGYTETDVLNSARILTGLSTSYDTGEFQYQPAWHHVGPVTVMGFTHANSDATAGRAVAVAYLTYLAHHRRTAENVARKLVVRFVADVPPPALVSRLADVYLANDTAIVPVLRELFRSSEFRSSIGGKVRRPLESMVATLRALDCRPPLAGTVEIQSLYWMTQDVQQAPLAWHPPNGYPDVAAAWQSPGSTLQRWSSTMNLAAGWWPRGLRTVDLTTMSPAFAPLTYGDLVDEWSRRLLFTLPSPEVRAAVCGFFDVTVATPLPTGGRAPFQPWRLPYVAALLLDSPHHAVR